MAVSLWSILLHLQNDGACTHSDSPERAHSADDLCCVAPVVAADVRMMRASAAAITDASEDSMTRLDTPTVAPLAEEQEWADAFESFLSSVSADSSQPGSPGGSSVNGRLVCHSLSWKYLMFQVHHTAYQQRPPLGATSLVENSAHVSDTIL